MDLYEGRKGHSGEPLDEYAFRLFSLIKTKKITLVVSDLLLKELRFSYTQKEIDGMLMMFSGTILLISSTHGQVMEAETLSVHRSVPKNDALHAILARDHTLIFVTRDNHFSRLDDLAKHYKPEELI